ncbi:MFS transporter [Bacillus rubiinfantis]|uniref:MFS transporter n=1 Tax=Bacillus rubiinfantis TaxID=1499680 RepID=UPI0005A65AD8|nr:MFS transporter [Bacillus rubiinfantis]
MNTQRWMSTQFFSFYLTWGIFLPYWSGWMIHTKGISVTQVSMIMSLGLVARGLFTLFVYPFLAEKYSSKTLLNGMAIGSFITILCYIPADSFSSLLAVTLLLHIVYPTLMPALDSAAGLLVQHNQLKDYGKSRSWGSLGFIVPSLFLTAITASMGDKVILWALLIGMVLFVCLGFLRAPDILSKKVKGQQKKQVGIRSLFHTRHFGLVLIIVILLQAAHASYYSYGYIFLQDIHAPQAFIGIILNISVFAEILFFTLADRVFRNFSVGALMTLSAMGSSVRWIMVFAFPTVTVFCLSQTLHAFSFAMSHYAFMKFLIQQIPDRLIPQAQGIYSALALSWSTAVFTMLGGVLYEMDPRLAFLGMILCTIPALLLAIVYQKSAVKKGN